MLGQALVRELAPREVAGLGRKEVRSLPRAYRSCDVTSREATRAAVQAFKPDVIVHTAAYTDVDGCETECSLCRAVNVDGTKHVADAAWESGAWLVFLSTDYVFDGKADVPYAEDHEVAPLNEYGRAKAEAEKYLLEGGRKAVIVRTSWLYGRGGPNFVDTVLALAESAPALRIVRDQRGRPTYVVDLARALCGIVDRLREAEAGREGSIPRVLHVANAGEATWYDFAREIIDAAGRHGVEVTPISSAELARKAMRPAYSVLDTTRFDQWLGRPLRPWKEALHAYLAERAKAKVNS
jgi:dTDP-4-dehydrorhamnose reductase